MALASDCSKVVVDATCTIGIVYAYKHLGDWFTADGRMSMTINIRCSRFRAANAPLRRTVYNRKALSIRDKVTVFESLAVSVLLTNSGAWLPLRHQQNCKN